MELQMSLLNELWADRLNEVKNHMDETEYESWASWRAACKKACPSVTFEGDKDIAQAMDGKRAIGEWDGTVGVLFKVQSAKVAEGFDEEKCYTVMTRKPGKSNMETHDYDGVSKAAVKAKLQKKGLEVVSIELKAKKVEEGKNGVEVVKTKDDAGFKSSHDVKVNGKVVGCIWQTEDGDWAAEASKSGNSWDMIDSKADAVSQITDEVGLNEKKVADDEYFISYKTGRIVELYVERSFKSEEAAQNYIDRQIARMENSRDADTDEADEDLDILHKCDVVTGKQLKREAPRLFEDSELAKKLVRGEQGAKGIMNTLDHWLTKLMIDKDKNRFAPAPTALKALRSYGFSEEQITAIREAAMEAAQTAIKTMQTKHGDRVPDKYLSSLPSSFGVFDLFLNVAEEIHVEYAALMRKLFDAKIDKIKDKLVIVKEDQLDESAGDDLKRLAMTMKREGNIKGHHKGMMKYHEHMQDAEEWNLKSHGRLSMSGRLALKNIAKHKKGYEEHKAAMSTMNEAKNIPGWFKAGAKVKLMPDYADVDPDEVFTLESADGGSGRIIDEDGKGWNISFFHVFPKNKTPAIHEEAVLENDQLQGLGRGLKGGSTTPPMADADAPTDVNTTPADKAAASDTDSEVKGPEEQDAPEFKVGDKVKPLIGPHKGEVHSVIHVFPDGSMNIKPLDLPADQTKYRLGAAKAQPDQVALAESMKPLAAGSLLGQIALVEAKKGSYNSEADFRAAARKLGYKVEKTKDPMTIVATCDGKPMGKFSSTRGSNGSGWSGTGKLELSEAKSPADELAALKKKRAECSDEMDRIIQDGGRIAENDPLNVKYKKLRAQINALQKSVKTTKKKIDEAAAGKDGFLPMGYGPKKGHTIEAYGRKGMKNAMWRKMFKNQAELEKWLDDNDATLEGSRDLDDNEKR